MVAFLKFLVNTAMQARNGSMVLVVLVWAVIIPSYIFGHEYVGLSDHDFFSFPVDT